MSKKKWVYTLTLRIVCLNEARGNDMTCYHCGVLLGLGERVYSRNASSSKSKAKFYHEECAKKVNIL